MSFDYTATADLTDELLREFGQALTITTTVVGTYDPATGTTSSSVTSHAGFGVVLDYGVHNTMGALIQAGDKQLLLTPDLVTPPVLDDVVEVNQVKYTIKNIKEVSPAGVPVLYDCNVRK